MRLRRPAPARPRNGVRACRPACHPEGGQVKDVRLRRLLPFGAAVVLGLLYAAGAIFGGGSTAAAWAPVVALAGGAGSLFHASPPARANVSRRAWRWFARAPTRSG